MAEEHNNYQIARKDAKNCFVESLNDSFPIGRVHFAFASYDVNRPAGQRQTNNIHIYIAMDEFLELCRKLECGELRYMLQTKKKAGDTKPLYQCLGGTAADKLAKQGRSRTDRKSLSRVAQLIPANKGDFLFIADSGPGETYRIGAEIVGAAESDYRGLNGYIYEIRTDDDRETENETPDIYCSFVAPSLPKDIEDIEKRFSELYQTEKKLDDITLDLVVMAPEEILVCKSSRKAIDIYVLEEDWAANDDYGHSTGIFADYYEAKAKLNADLSEEMKNGCLSDWMQDDNYQFDTDENSYEGWVDGEYSSSHYHVTVTKLTLNIPNSVYGTLGRDFIDSCRVEDFIEQIEPWEELGKLSDEQYKLLIADPTIPDRIDSALGKNDGYWESYWESVSEVAHTLVREYLSKNKCTKFESGKM